MKTVEEIERFVERVAHISWMSAPALTDRAEALLAEYARRLKIVMQHFAVTQSMGATEADLHVCGIGMKTPESDRLIDALFELPIDVPVREHLIFNLHAFFFWNTDDELRQFENAYEPLIELYELGFTTSGGPNDDGNELELTLGYRNGLQDYHFPLSS